MKICLIGDSCIDEIITGTCDRLSPEAPVPILKVDNVSTKPGMAGNVYDNLCAFGFEIDYYTNEEEIVKTRAIDSKSGQHMLRIDQDTQVESFNQKLDYSDYNAVIISDYNKGFVTYDLVKSIRSKFQGPIFIDTKKTDLAQFEGCFVKINSVELEAATSLPSDHWLIVTMGGSGTRYKSEVYPAPQVSVFDVCGAGDTFLAALACQYLTTMSVTDSIMFANKCAAITVQNIGVYSLTQDDIYKVCKS